MINTTAPRSFEPYTVLERSLVGNTIYEPGQTCEYDGLPSENLAPQTAEGHARYAEYLRTNEERKARMKAENSESGVGDPEKFAKAFAQELAKANADAEDRIARAVADAAAVQAEASAKQSAEMRAQMEAMTRGFADMMARVQATAPTPAPAADEPAAAPSKGKAAKGSADS